MKILIMSDSHGLMDEIQRVINRHKDEVDYLIHCGDSELSHQDSLLKGVTVVRGNCDLDDRFPEDVMIEVANKRIFVTHGHRYGVKNNLQRLQYRAMEEAANIVCFGHSHILYIELVNGILFINPGSMRLPRLRKEKTYVMLSLIEDKAHVTIHDVATGKSFKKNFSFVLPKS